MVDSCLVVDVSPGLALSNGAIVLVTVRLASLPGGPDPGCTGVEVVALQFVHVAVCQSMQCGMLLCLVSRRGCMVRASSDAGLTSTAGLCGPPVFLKRMLAFFLYKCT